MVRVELTEFEAEALLQLAGRGEDEWEAENDSAFDTHEPYPHDRRVIAAAKRARGKIWAGRHV